MQDLIVEERSYGYLVESTTEELLKTFVAPEIVFLTPSELRAKYYNRGTITRQHLVVEDSEKDVGSEKAEKEEKKKKGNDKEVVGMLDSSSEDSDEEAAEIELELAGKECSSEVPSCT